MHPHFARPSVVDAPRISSLRLCVAPHTRLRPFHAREPSRQHRHVSSCLRVAAHDRKYDIEYHVQRTCATLARASYLGLLAARDALQWVERRFSLGYRLRRCWDGVVREALVLEARWRLRQQVLDATQDFIRLWPARRRRLQAWLATPVGRVSAFVFLFVAMRTGMFFPLVRLALTQLWLVPLVTLAYIRTKAARASPHRHGQGGQEGPGNGAFDNVFFRTGRRPTQPPGRDGTGSRGFSGDRGRQRANSGNNDTVIDVDWEVVN